MVTVAAPGGDFAYEGNELCTLPTTTNPVTIPCWAFDMVLSTSRAGYSWSAGTSMSAPAAAAVAALIKQRFPNISVGELKNRLAQSADDMGKPGVDPYYGRGFVNAYRAVTQ
jgi:subtilisin family serine protease